MQLYKHKTYNCRTSRNVVIFCPRMQTAPMATLPSSILEQNHKISILIWLLSPRQECSVVQWVQWSVLSLSTYLASSICSYLHYCAFQAALCLSVCIPHKDPGTIWSISLSVCLSVCLSGVQDQTERQTKCCLSDNTPHWQQSTNQSYTTTNLYKKTCSLQASWARTSCNHPALVTTGTCVSFVTLGQQLLLVSKYLVRPFWRSPYPQINQRIIILGQF